MAVSNISWMDAQYAVLGDVLIEGDQLAASLLTKTRESDYTGPCREVFKAIRSIHDSGRVVDPVSIANEVKGRVSQEFLLQLMEITPTAANFLDHVDLLKEQAAVVTIHELCDAIKEADTMDAIRPKISDLNRIQARQTGAVTVSIQEAMRDFFRRMSETPEYIPMPIPELNSVVMPELGDTIWLGAYSSCGKTALALQWADLLSRQYRVGFFSLETRQEKLADRYAAMKAAVSLHSIKTRNFTPTDSERLCESVTAVDDLRMEIIPMPALTAADIERIATMKQLQIVIVDYVQIVESKGRTEAEEIGTVAKELQQMAKRNKFLVIGLSQLTEDNMNNGYEPFNHSLRGSRALEHTADIIMLMYLADKKKQKGNRILKVSKNKDGEIKKIELEFDGPRQTFRKASVLSAANASPAQRRKLLADAAEARRDVALCAACARKLEEGYTVTRVLGSSVRNVDCWLCGQRLSGTNYTLDKNIKITGG